VSRSLGALHLGPLAEVPGLLEASAHKLQAQEREGLRVLRAAQASLQDVAARATCAECPCSCCRRNAAVGLTGEAHCSVEWDVRPEGRLDAVPVFASLAWSAVGEQPCALIVHQCVSVSLLCCQAKAVPASAAQLFDAASQAYLTDVKVKACALAWLESGGPAGSSWSRAGRHTRAYVTGARGMCLQGAVIQAVPRTSL
jgi:hypothetical protein